MEVANGDLQSQDDFARIGARIWPDEPSFLLSGKRVDPHILPPSPKKKPHEIESGEKNAKQVELKKPKTTFVVGGDTTFTSPPPAPMAASSVEMTVASVPAPKALWAGLGMLGALVLWRRVCALRAAV